MLNQGASSSLDALLRSAWVETATPLAVKIRALSFLDRLLDRFVVSQRKGTLNTKLLRSLDATLATVLNRASD